MILKTLAYGSVKRISRAVLEQRKNYSCNTPCSLRPVVSNFTGERVGGGELNKMVGVHGQCENGESNKNNL